MHSLVSLQHVPTYDPQSVLHAMRECLAPWGGMGAFGPSNIIRPRRVPSSLKSYC